MQYNGNKHGQLILSVRNEKHNVIDENIFCPTKWNISLNLFHMIRK